MSVTVETPTASAAAPRLRRSLTLRDLVLYGVIVIQPVAPMSVFGVISERGHGHVVTTVLLALVAMLFTAVSYGRMARVYPSAGSAFTYVARELSPALGYVTGWSMVMDYLLNPVICIIWIGEQAHQLVPAVPYAVWAVLVAGFYTGLNLQGIQTSARVNALLAAGMGAVVAVFLGAAAHHVLAGPHAGAAFWLTPFYDAARFDAGTVLGGTSVAVLTYIGFDGISTLSEEAKDPRRNILLATVLTCVLIGVLSALEVYAAQLVWPAAERYPDVDTAFTFIAGRAWKPLFTVVGLTLVVANLGSGMAAQLGAARLLYGMGRSGVLPPAFFGVVDARHHVPRNAVLFVGALALAGAFVLPAVAGADTGYELAANLLNFGALLAFMGVNAAALVHYHLRGERRGAGTLLPPLAGFVICALLWWSLSVKARVLGAVWMAAGLAYGAWRTRGFRGDLVTFEAASDEGG